MTITLYGFASCDTVKKARNWLAANGVAHRFFDYRKDKLAPDVVDGWFRRAGWQSVLNRSATSFKEMPDEAKQGIDEAKARAMVLAEKNLIKRPVLDTGETLLFGFKPDTYERALDR